MAKDFITNLKIIIKVLGKRLSNSTIGTKVTAVRLLNWAENQAWDYTNTWTGISLAREVLRKEIVIDLDMNN